MSTFLISNNDKPNGKVKFILVETIVLMLSFSANYLDGVV